MCNNNSENPTNKKQYVYAFGDNYTEHVMVSFQQCSRFFLVAVVTSKKTECAWGQILCYSLWFNKIKWIFFLRISFLPVSLSTVL